MNSESVHLRGRARLARNQLGIAKVLVVLIITLVAGGAVVGGLFATGILKLGQGGMGGTGAQCPIVPSETGLTPTDVRVSGTSTQSTITFTETGLKPGTKWSVTMYNSLTGGPGATPLPINGSTLSSTNSSITFTLANGTYVYGVTTPGYSATPASGTIAVTGGSVSQPIAFAGFPTPCKVTFTASGLKPGTRWTLTVQPPFTNKTTFTTTNSSINVSALTNETLYFTASAPGYTAIPASGEIETDGASVSQPIAFILTPSRTTLTFTETGMKAGTRWSVTVYGSTLGLNGTTLTSTNSSVMFTLPNGTYTFNVTAPGYAPNPPSGTIEVNGTPITKPIAFAPTVPVTFSETGLGATADWTVTLHGSTLNVNGTTQSSANSSIPFQVGNGTYSYSVSAEGFTPSPAAGTFNVSGMAVSEPIGFTLVTATTSPTSGANGTGVALLADGLAPNTEYSAYFDTTQEVIDFEVTSFVTNTTGGDIGTFVVPSVIPSGSYYVDLFEGSELTYVASASSQFTVTVTGGTVPSAMPPWSVGGGGAQVSGGTTKPPLGTPGAPRGPLGLIGYSPPASLGAAVMLSCRTLRERRLRLCFGQVRPRGWNPLRNSLARNIGTRELLIPDKIG
jgi:hypothetical protein